MFYIFLSDMEKLYFNKDENVHRYENRGGKFTFGERERERERKREREIEKERKKQNLCYRDIS